MSLSQLGKHKMDDQSKILIISDVHGNAEALRAVMNAEDDADHLSLIHI